MIPDENKSENVSDGVPDGVSVGTLVITGFTGSPQMLREHVLKSEQVDDATVQRSGNQFEVAVSFSHPDVTSNHLFELIDLPGYDARLQGVQVASTPTIVVALSPARTGRRRIPRLATPRLGRRTSTPDLWRRPTSTPGTDTAADTDPIVQPVAPIPTGPESDIARRMRLTVLYTKKTARILAQVIAYVTPIVISFISLVITVTVTFTREKSVLFWALTKRVAHAIVVTGPMVLGYIAIVINLIVDNLFGSGSDSSDEQKPPPSNSPDPKNNQIRPK